MPRCRRQIRGLCVAIRIHHGVSRTLANEDVSVATVKLSSSSTALLAIKPQKVECRQEARGLVATMGRLETGVLTVLWNQVLQRFQLCSASLQSADQDLNTACAIYQSLIVFVQKLRPTYAAVECTAKQLMNCKEYRHNDAADAQKKSEIRWIGVAA